MSEKYPKEVKLKDGRQVHLKLLDLDNMDQLIHFFQALPLEDRMYLRNDVFNPKYVKRRFGEINYDLKYPVIALNKEEIVGIGTLFRAEFGWERNLGEIRCVVSRSFQRKGLCTILVRELFLRALKTDLYKIQAEVIEDQKSAIATFKRMGFHSEAILKKHVTDIHGNRRNLVIMSLDIQDLWSIMEDFIPDSIYVT